MNPPTICMIVAADEAYGIGNRGKIQWQSREDMQFFKKVTTNQVVVMGVNTAKSIIEDRGHTSGPILPNRQVIVLWDDRTNLHAKDQEQQERMEQFSYFYQCECLFNSPGVLRNIAQKYPGKIIYLAGGMGTYQHHHQECSHLLYTSIKGYYDQDRQIKPIIDDWRMHSILEAGVNLSDQAYLSLRRRITGHQTPQELINHFEQLLPTMHQ